MKHVTCHASGSRRRLPTRTLACAVRGRAASACGAQSSTTRPAGSAQNASAEVQPPPKRCSSGMVKAAALDAPADTASL